jgi:hypothetical protein
MPDSDSLQAYGNSALPEISFNVVIASAYNTLFVEVCSDLKWLPEILVF